MTNGGDGPPCCECRASYGEEGVPCETQGDEFCEVDYPPAEPTEPEVWTIWSRYWMVQALGWDMLSCMVTHNLTDQDAQWWLWAFGQIDAAVGQRRAIEMKEAQGK